MFGKRDQNNSALLRHFNEISQDKSYNSPFNRKRNFLIDTEDFRQTVIRELNLSESIVNSELTPLKKAAFLEAAATAVVLSGLQLSGYAGTQLSSGFDDWMNKISEDLFSSGWRSCGGSMMSNAAGHLATQSIVAMDGFMLNRDLHESVYEMRKKQWLGRLGELKPTEPLPKFDAEANITLKHAEFEEALMISSWNWWKSRSQRTQFMFFLPEEFSGISRSFLMNSDIQCLLQSAITPNSYSNNRANYRFQRGEPTILQCQTRAGAWAGSEVMLEGLVTDRTSTSKNGFWGGTRMPLYPVQIYVEIYSFAA